MKKKSMPLLSRRQFAQRAAMLSATASIVPADLFLTAAPASSTAQIAQPPPTLTPEGQTEAESRYQQILGLYGKRLTEEQKTNLKRMCEELQPALERIRSFPLKNSAAPALYLKPLIERDKKSQLGATPQPSATKRKP